MSFLPVPTESRKSINRAGKLLVENDYLNLDLDWAKDLANRWRACHAYPINTFQATLRNKIGSLSGDPIIAQRLKRMPTIVDKLRRYPNMQLSTMQDIGGVRAILARIEDVYFLVDNYKKNKNFTHELLEEKDYIKHPRDEDGYRSLHLIYKYRNSRTSNYDGLRIEMQFRTKLQHMWATAVETMGTLLGQALKSRQGEQDWLDFFALISSAFAYRESQPPIPKYSNLSLLQTSQRIAEYEKRLGALEKMVQFKDAISIIQSKSQGYSYHLIVLDSLRRKVSVTPYDRLSIEQALIDYTRIEKDALDGSRIEPVLVSAGPIATLRRAYPNFFLDLTDFVDLVREITIAR